MLRKFICCFNFKSNIPEIIPPQMDINFEDICVRITDGESPLNKLGIFDTHSLYDANEWLNTVDNPIEWKDCIPFVPPIAMGFVIKVYDGDTITIASKLPYPDSPLYRFSVRLNGIDCPEIKSKDKYEKECAQIAKQVMTDLVFNRVVLLKNVGTEKYGRILADVYIDNIHLNDYLLKKRLAVSYDGGTKKCPKNWMDYHLKGEL